MKYQSTVVGLSALMGLASASPIHVKREVPQERSHNIYLDITREFLNLNNPKGIVDPVFGLLGNAAAAAGAGTVTNLDCLKQETADQAFTNAKAIGDVRGMAGALVYQAIERNTGKIGLESVLCNEKPVNAEIGQLTQHQDPAAVNAGAINKAITLTLAKLLASIGVDPLLALESGTFEPGDLNDNTAKGFTCDTADDTPGCIFSQRLLVLDATPDEILAVVAGIKPTFTGTGVISATNVDFAGLKVAQVTEDVAGFVTIATAPAPAEATATLAPECLALLSSTSSCTVITTTVAATATKAVLASYSNLAATAVQTNVAAGVNVQSFTGTLGGPAPPVVSTAGDARPFNVAGDTFLNAGAAIGRSCDKQKNACANAANSGQLSGGVAQCDAQNAECRKAANLRKRAASFGSCSDPSIKFGIGFDGRKEASFIATNQGDFNHGSAQKIGIIATFICQRLKDSCKADASIVSLCDTAAAAATAATQDQSAADAFNDVLLGGGVADAAAPQVTATPVAGKGMKAVVMTITQCS
jgi:hypothetical protein